MANSTDHCKDLCRDYPKCKGPSRVLNAEKRKGIFSVLFCGCFFVIWFFVLVCFLSFGLLFWFVFLRCLVSFFAVFGGLFCFFCLFLLCCCGVTFGLVVFVYLVFA